MRIEDIVPTPPLNEAERILVVEAHPDDAEVAAGATLAALAEQGKEVHILSLTGGDRGTSDPSLRPEEVRQLRVREGEAAAAVLGARTFSALDGEDMLLSNTPEMRGRVVSALREIGADTLFCLDPALNDESHPDHRAAGQIALAAAILSPFPLVPFADGAPCSLRRIVLMATDRPNVALDVAHTWDKKWQAIQAHASQFPLEQLGPLQMYLSLWCEDYGRRHGAEIAEPLRLLTPMHLHMNPGDSAGGRVS